MAAKDFLVAVSGMGLATPIAGLLTCNALPYTVRSRRSFFPIGPGRLNQQLESLAAALGAAEPLRGGAQTTDAEPSRMAECGFCFGLG